MEIAPWAIHIISSSPLIIQINWWVFQPSVNQLVDHAIITIDDTQLEKLKTLPQNENYEIISLVKGENKKIKFSISQTQQLCCNIGRSDYSPIQYDRCPVCNIRREIIGAEYKCPSCNQ